MTDIKVLTYNIRHARGIDDWVDLNRIAGVLAASEADIICLQEVDRGLPRSGMIHQAKALADSLDFQFAYHANFGLPVSGMGNALLSRFPIYSTWNNALPFSGEPRGLLATQIASPIANIHVYCSHWGLDAKQREKQAQECARLVRQDHREQPQPIVLCGDLNAEVDSLEVKSLLWQASLMDAGPKDAMTYPTDALRAKIDYVLIRGFEILKVRTIMTESSDHLPILATLKMGK